MPVLIKPNVEFCNLNCKYCYQRRLRKQAISEDEKTWDIDKVVGVIRRIYKDSKYKGIELTIHGGEPLLMGHEDMERLLAETYELQQRTSIQTNGLLIDDRYIEMFKKYKTNVGVSIDGWGRLNACRTNEENTRKLMNIIQRLLDNKIGVSIISTVNVANAGDDERLEEFKRFIKHMSDKGICGRINPCYAPDTECMLPVDRLVQVYLDLARFMTENGTAYKWSPFQDILKRLNGEEAVCVFSSCDVHHTPSAIVVLGDGTITNCLRTEIYLRSDRKLDVRDDILKNIPQEYGGCKDCKYFNVCHGGCPSCTISGDWREKDVFCEVWKALFEYYENMMNSVIKAISVQRLQERLTTQTLQDMRSIEYIRAGVRHLDSDLLKKQGKPSHKDGITYIDGDVKYIDSSGRFGGRA